MNDSFVHYAEPSMVLDDPERRIVTSVGSVGGMTLAYLGVNKENILLTLPELRTLVQHLGYCDTETRARTDGYFLYRVAITRYPAGACWAEGSYGGLDPDWSPDGWSADDDWIARFGTDRFIWPTTNREYRSKRSAKGRAKLIESYGATARIDQSSLITWPRDEFEEVW